MAHDNLVLGPTEQAALEARAQAEGDTSVEATALTWAERLLHQGIEQGLEQGIE